MMGYYLTQILIVLLKMGSCGSTLASHWTPPEADISTTKLTWLQGWSSLTRVLEVFQGSKGGWYNADLNADWLLKLWC